jgi:hypothetical protein
MEDRRQETGDRRTFVLPSPYHLSIPHTLLKRQEIGRSMNTLILNYQIIELSHIFDFLYPMSLFGIEG